MVLKLPFVNCYYMITNPDPDKSRYSNLTSLIFVYDYKSISECVTIFTGICLDKVLTLKAQCWKTK